MLTRTGAYVDSLIKETEVGCIKLLQEQACTLCCDFVKNCRDGFSCRHWQSELVSYTCSAALRMLQVFGERTQTELLSYWLRKTWRTGTVKCGHAEVQNSDDWFLARRIDQESDGYLSPFKPFELIGSDWIIPGLLQCAVPHLNFPSAIYTVCLAFWKLGCKWSRLSYVSLASLVDVRGTVSQVLSLSVSWSDWWPELHYTSTQWYLADCSCECINLLNPTGHVMHQQFNIQQLYVLPTLNLCVLYLSENKQRLVPLTA